mmetsp:Transcript_94757/g.306422  ORF Transcript_94757/g.306422 Transcript_94757/m.306422 type:complete len:260 (+) Transcript_94757:290-1069(+)
MARTVLVLAHILISRHTDPRLRGRERLATMAIVLFLPVQSILQPVQTLVQAIACSGARGLDEPAPTFREGAEPEFVGHLGRGHGVRQVLLVGENEKWHTHEELPLLPLPKHFIKLVLDFSGADSVVAVHDEDQGVAFIVVLAPKRPHPVTAADVPNREADQRVHAFVLDNLDVETDGRYSLDDLPDPQLVEHGRLTCSIQANHQRLGLLSMAQCGAHCGREGPSGTRPNEGSLAMTSEPTYSSHGIGKHNKTSRSSCRN